MTVVRGSNTGAAWRKVFALLLGVLAVGLPINNISDYAVLVILTVAIFCGGVSTRPRAWVAAGAIVIAGVTAQLLLSSPRIEEGHNVFLPGSVLERGLPGDVYRHLAAEFDKQYPLAERCDPGKPGCWRNGGAPDSTFGFSADGIWRKADFSRAITALDFSDPVWQRLGFVNELRYNWTGDTDVKRAWRDRRFWMGPHRWHLTLPWFEMVRLPAAYVGGKLCWRGNVMWEGEGGRFAPLIGDGCRAIQAADADRRIVGVAIKPDTLAMQLTPPWSIRLARFIQGIVLAATVLGLVGILVRVRARQMIIPAIIIGLSVLIIAVDDASFLGALRPFDGGDDGLFYDGTGRVILQKLLAGDLYGALEGGEKVFYYGGPGLRYFRAIEHIVFGESYLGYLSLILLFPFTVYALFRRFLPENWSLALIIIFIAVPVGILFGTSFVQYEQWASRGFADPAAYILFVAGVLPIVSAGSTEFGNVTRAFCGALLLALAIFMKPIVAPAAAVLLGGAGMAALYWREWSRLAALCIGFLPVFSMALHNWVFGRTVILFSANVQDANLLVLRPSNYLAAASELGTFNLDGDHLGKVVQQIAHWLSGPAVSYATVPLNGIGVAIVIYVVVRGHQFDPWLRLIGASALAQHVVALFYTAATARYHFLTWFLTMLVVTVWFHRVGVGLVERRYPVLSRRFAVHPWSRWLASGLNRLQKAST
jgi:hypothetical protein